MSAPFDPFDVPLPEDESSHVYKVSELTLQIKGRLEQAFGRVTVQGELSNVTLARSGHAYLTLKDDKAQLAVVMFRSQLSRVKFTPEQGMEAIVTGRVTVYAQRGQYQVIADRMEPVGAGTLEVALRQLHEKLSREGLFDPEHKRPIPFLPRRIAVITSPTGAAVRDILRVIGRRFPPADIALFPVQVQGEEAAGQIARAIRAANRHGGFDVAIVGRGGGSIEDLWAFNEEVVVRAIYDSAVPIVSAVGHETDVTLSDLASDRRALTPSEAAELVVPKLSDLRLSLRSLTRQMTRHTMRQVAHLRSELRSHRAGLRPDALRGVVRMKMQRLDELQRRATDTIAQRLNDAKADLKRHAATLHALSPLAVLARGYSVTRDAETGKVLKDSSEVTEGQHLETILSQGKIHSTVRGLPPCSAPCPSDDNDNR